MNRIQAAFETIPRQPFIPDITDVQAKQDRPFSIGFQQTNSQPSTVRQMLMWLDVHEGSSVLDVGSGSGWTSALLGNLVGESGSVTAVERIPELVERSRATCRSLGLRNIEFHEAGSELGWPTQAPYDRILVSAAADSLPDELVEQLKAPGRMVIPIHHTIYVISRNEKGYDITESHPGFVFVPLIT